MNERIQNILSDLTSDNVTDQTIVNYSRLTNADREKLDYLFAVWVISQQSKNNAKNVKQ